MNQQAKDRLSHLLESTPEDRRPKAKMEAKDKEEVPDTTTKSCLTDRKQEHLHGNCTKKRERFPTTIVEYQENEISDLLALELPQRGRRSRSVVRCCVSIARNQDIMHLIVQKGATKQTHKVT
jgi:hypothetical protein